MPVSRRLGLVTGGFTGRTRVHAACLWRNFWKCALLPICSCFAPRHSGCGERNTTVPVAAHLSPWILVLRKLRSQMATRELLRAWRVAKSVLRLASVLALAIA